MDLSLKKSLPRGLAALGTVRQSLPVSKRTVGGNQVSLFRRPGFLRLVGALEIALLCGAGMPADANAPRPAGVESGLPAGGLSLDDVSTRSQILSAQQSPDGSYIAYICLTPDLRDDGYEVAISVRRASNVAAVFTVSRYHLRTAEALDSTLGHPEESISQLRWAPDSRHLLFTDHEAGKMRLRLWSLGDLRTESIGPPRDKIVFSSPPGEQPMLETSDWKPAPSPRPIDRAKIIQRDKQFLGFEARRQDGFVEDRSAFRFNWQFSSLSPIPAKDVEENSRADGGRNFERIRTGTEIVETIPGSTDPSGKYVAIEEIGYRHVDSLVSGEEFERITIKTTDGRNTIASIESRDKIISIWGVGWNELGTEFYLIEHGFWSNKIVAISTSGTTRVIVEDESDLDEPEQDLRASGAFHTIRSVGYNVKLNRLLLVRSKGMVPGELVSIDLNSGAISSIFSPNARLSGTLEDIRSRVELGDGQFGVLYLPSKHASKPFPLVITS